MGPRRAAGYGRLEAEYLRSANDRTVVAIQIETGDAVDHIDEILSVQGIDVALVGLGDLSADLGCHLEFAAPRVVAAWRRCSMRVHATTSCRAWPTPTTRSRPRLHRAGIRLVAVGSDDVFLMDGSSRALDGLRSLR